MNFFPKLFRVLLLLLFITILCSCDPMTFDGIPPTCYPVSYTHLDVYKRQAQYRWTDSIY